MTTTTKTQTIPFASLPPIGVELDGGTFAGITTKPDGAHYAVFLLPEQGENLTWQQALAWADEQGGELPTRPVASMLFANVKDKLKPEWHWTSEAYNASCAWLCTFDDGYIGTGRKSFGGCAVAVRLIPLTA